MTAQGAVPRSILDGVQYLRGLAALLVVVAHENGIMGKPEYLGSMVLPSIEEASGFAVAVFFVISGFIIVSTALDPHGAPKVGRTEFVRRRAVRILPFLWLCTIGYNLLSWAGTGVFDGAAMVRTLLLSPVGDLKPNVAWSLRHELLFYLLFAVTMLGRARWRGWMVLWVAIVPLLFLLVYDLRWLPPRHGVAWFDLFSVTLMGSRTGAHLQFGIGMLLGLLYQRAPWRARTGSTVMLLALLAAAVLVVVSPRMPGLARLLWWSASAGGIVTLAILARPWRGVAGRGAMLLGNASFSVYLVHNPVMLVLLALAAASGMRPVGPSALAAFLFGAVLLSLVAGVIVHLLVERPLIRAIDRRTRPARAGPPVALIPDGA